MCNASCITFASANLARSEVSGKKVLEIGSCDVNGSLRPIIKSLEPASYTGVDINPGPGVDVVCAAEDIIEKFGKEQFDIVISTEMLEHVRDWRKVVSNIKNICKPEGAILITTRSPGFDYHGYPYDFWRYEASDITNIFSDCIVEKIEDDKKEPGILFKVRKPAGFKENDLSGYALYSIITGRRVEDISDKELADFRRRFARLERFDRATSIIKEQLKRLIRFIRSML
jgi:SAM-dependent methyltransferase